VHVAKGHELHDDGQPQSPEGQWTSAKNGHPLRADRRPKAAARGQPRIANNGHHTVASDGCDKMQGEGLASPADGQLKRAQSLQPIIDEIRAHHRQRCYAMEQRKRADLSLGSYLRVVLGWNPGLPADERKKIAVLAQDLITCGEKLNAGKQHELADTEHYTEHAEIILATLMSRDPWDTIEDAAVDRMEKLAQQLPVWESFGKAVRGFGPKSLAVIIGEAGDLGSPGTGNYSNHSKLWKRMGLAVLKGVRQGGLSKSAAKGDWIAHGYNRKRRSHMWNIGDALIKGNADGKYRAYYLSRKEYERARAEADGLKVVPAAKIPKAKAEQYMSDGHVHRRAQRYMEKKFLRDLWQAWRATGASPNLANPAVPAAPDQSSE
jgi:hypothetical protein